MMNLSGKESWFLSLIKHLPRYAHRFLSLIILYFFLFFPLIYSRTLEDAFEFPKQYVLVMLVIMGFISLIVSGRKWRFPLSVEFSSLMLLVVFALLSSGYAYSGVLALRGGMFFFFQFFLAFLFLQVQYSLFHGKCRIAIIICLSAVAALSIGQLYYSSLYDFDAVRLGVSPSFGDWRDYIQVSLGNTDFLAGFLCMFFPFLVVLFLRTARFSYSLAFCIILWTLTLIITWSVSALFSLTFFFVVLILIRPRMFLSGKKLFFLLGVAGAALSFWAFNHQLNPLPGGIIEQAFASERWHLGGPTRVIIWENALQIFRGHMFLGTGFNNFIYLFPAYVSPFIIRNPQFSGYIGQFTNAVHNDAFEFFTQLGLPGGLLFLLICLRMIRWGWIRQNWVIISFFSLFLLNGQMSFPFRLVVPSTFFCLLVALRASQSACKEMKVSFVLKSTGLLICLLVFFLTGRELIARTVYKQARGLQYAEQHEFIGVADRIRQLDSSYQIARLEQKDEEAESIRREMVLLIEKLPTRNQQLEKLKKAFYYSPYYYDASSRYADMLMQHEQYEKASQVYEYVLPVLNANDVYWGYMMSLIYQKRYEEALSILSLMRGRIFRHKDYVYFRLAGEYLEYYNKQYQQYDE